MVVMTIGLLNMMNSVQKNGRKHMAAVEMIICMQLLKLMMVDIY